MWLNSLSGSSRQVAVHSHKQEEMVLDCIQTSLPPIRKSGSRPMSPAVPPIQIPEVTPYLHGHIKNKTAMGVLKPL